jgi:hypothetical protein
MLGLVRPCARNVSIALKALYRHLLALNQQLPAFVRER